MKLTLQDINDAVTAKYAPLEIDLGGGDVVVMRPALRMKESERAQLSEMQAARNKATAAAEKAQKDYEAAVAAGDEDAVEPAGAVDDLTEYITELITLTVGDAAKSERLITAVGDDLATLIEIVTEYGKSTQPGEASTSGS